MASLAEFYEDLIAHMEASTPIGAVVADRIHLERFPRASVEPVITVETFDSEEQEFLGGDTPDQAMVVVSFSCWSKIADETLTVRDVVFTLFKDFTGLWNTRTNIKATLWRGDVSLEQSPASQMLRRSLRFEFWYAT